MTELRRVRHLVPVSSAPPAPVESDPAVVTLGAGVRYGRRWGLVDCSLQIPAGAVAAVVGRNGAGKSTLLHMLAGLLRPDAGSVTLLGARSWPAKGEALARIGFVGQDRPLYRALRVRELLTVGRRLNRGWDQRYAVERLRDQEIPIDQKVHRLSRGQQTQLAVVMALAKRPGLLILDEPLADLDPVARREVMGTVMAELAEKKVTVILSSHSLVDLTRACDWLVIMGQGKIRVAAPIDRLLAEHQIILGPTGLADRVIDRAAIIARHRGERQSALLVVRGDAVSELDPRWDRRKPTVEDLVFGYLGTHAETT